MDDIKRELELGSNFQILIRDSDGRDVGHENWEEYQKLRNDGSVLFVITCTEDNL